MSHTRFFPSRKRLFTVSLILLLLASLLLAAASFAQSPPSTFKPLSGAPHSTNFGIEAACQNARTVGVGQTLTQTDRWHLGGVEWVRITVSENNRYRLQVNAPGPLQLAVFAACDPQTDAVMLHGGQLEFTARRSGDYYLLLNRDRTAPTSNYEVTFTALPPYRPSAVSAAEVPEAVQRRALDFLEELRGSDLAPEWRDARLNTEARILYRPDMLEPAYFEFSVESPAGEEWVPAGFIQLAAGDHDYPISHWDVEEMSPTQELAEFAPLGSTLTEFYKLDALSYAAEYEEFTPLGFTTVATDVLNLGDLPERIAGLDAVPQEPAELVNETVDSDGNTTYEGPEELPLSEQDEWDSWAALKEGYRNEYQPFLAALEERAEDEWELASQLDQYGESLMVGDERSVYGLPSQNISAIEVTGEGADPQYLQQEELTDGGTLTGVRLTVIGEPADRDARLAFDVNLVYASGLTEKVPFAIIASDWFSGVYLPMVTQGGSAALSSRSPDAPAEATAWGPWTYYWADGCTGCIRYGQISANTGVNTSGCASGCGGTAWAMLFAWVDQRADEGHPIWNNHWGLYRVNGGLGSNTKAPYSQDSGVANMTWEIRNDIGTFCLSGQGATWPWNMINASNYVQPRATAAWRMQTKYDPTGLCWFGACNANRDLARNQIIYRRAPAVVGNGWLKHYPMAYGYAWRKKRTCVLWSCWNTYSRWFYVNNGWYGANNGWTNADDIWFAGIYRPW